MGLLDFLLNKSKAKALETTEVKKNVAQETSKASTRKLELPEFVELEFALPFYEMYFPDTYNDNKLPKNPFELRKLAEELHIRLDTDFLFKTYEQTEYGKGDIFVFYSQQSKDTFIYFDLLKDEHDQMNMIVLGVRVPIADREKIREKLWELYFKSTTRSDFQEDYFNQSLWRVVTDKIPYNKRKVHHFES